MGTSTRRPSKRMTSGTATPLSTDVVSSDEEYSDGGDESSGVDEERIRRNDKKFAVSSYTKKREDRRMTDSTSALFKDHDLSDLSLKPGS